MAEDMQMMMMMIATMVEKMISILGNLLHPKSTIPLKRMRLEILKTGRVMLFVTTSR